MLQALCIVSMLAGLWCLLSLLTRVRQQDLHADWRAGASGERTASRWRRQRQISTWLTSAIAAAPLACIAVAWLTSSPSALLGGAAIGLHLFLGAGYVHRCLASLPCYSRTEEPSLHAILLALSWPIWAIRVPAASQSRHSR